MAKNRSLQGVNEDFEPIFNAVFASAVVFQQAASIGTGSGYNGHPNHLAITPPYTNSSSLFPVNKLNARQAEAAKYIDGPLLVLAGAGSGKTSVITRKIIYLVNKVEIPARHIIAVTFTNKAAREMKNRVSEHLSGKQGRGLIISTFHNLGLRMIRQEYKALKLKSGFSIFDAQDSKALLTELVHKEKALAEDDVAMIQHQISNWKNDLLSPSVALSRAETDQQTRAAHIYEAYNRCLRAYNAVDFDDLILLPTQLLQQDAAIREKWQHRVRYLLVDEYQDTNASQYQLIQLLTGRRAAFTLVGDDDQSIYAWRGANPENMALLSNDYPQLKVVKLEQNYRSTVRILKAANQVIANNPHVFDKKLWSELGLGKEVRIISCASEDQEAERVAQEIINQKIQYRRNYRDFAVLYRGNHQSRSLELKLQAYQIPYKVSGGQSFFARSEIKDIMAYLRLILNPDDDNAFLRIVNTPRREIGPSTLEKLGNYANERNTGLFAACDEFGLEQVLKPKALRCLQQFCRWLEQVRQALAQETNSVAVLKQMLAELDYEAWLIDQSPSPKAAEKRIENVYQLFSSIANMLEKDPDADIEAVIGKLVLLDILEQQQEEDDSDRVQLLTLHASKGLEYPYVFILGLEEEILPHRNSIEEDNIEEERRLMYVGITRAKQELTLTMAKKRKQFGEEFETSPSRFLEELPQGDIIWEGKPGDNKTETEKQALGKAHINNLKSLLN